jgi:predicted dehydrogenase
MSRKSSRRQFLRTTAATGIGFWVAAGVAPRVSRAANEQIAFASVGIGGKGSSDSEDASRAGRMVAICDVDEKRLDGAAGKFKDAKKFTDFRKMLDEMGAKIDAVTVSTPDHAHAVAALMAMRMGKHCFVQKPMTQSIFEARLMGQVAREKKVATQMGNQGTAEAGVRKAAALIKAGVLGTVSEVHVWTNRPIWPQGGTRPEPKPCPAELQWDSWISRAPMRPYAPGYHPFAWRGWWDFGTGALGDMACHTANMPFMGLNLRDPIAVEAKTSGHNGDSYPKWSIIKYDFPALDGRAALKMTWYDGGKLPEPELLDGKKPSGSGCVIIGDKGKLFSPNDYGASFELLGGAKEVPVEFKKSTGHFQEWIDAIKGGDPAMSNFQDYAGPLTETILLGNLAVWADGQKVDWDAKNLKAKTEKDVPGIEKIIRPEPRAGYTL